MRSSSTNTGELLGLITLEDLLEELFGEIRDEFDYDGPEVLRDERHGEWLVSGAIEVGSAEAKRWATESRVGADIGPHRR